MFYGESCATDRVGNNTKRGGERRGIDKEMQIKRTKMENEIDANIVDRFA